MKKLISALLLLCLLLTLAACSKTDNNIAIPGGNPASSTPDTSIDHDLKPPAPPTTDVSVSLAITASRYNAYGDLDARTDYTYNETGVLIKRVHTSFLYGQENIRYENVYNDYGDLTESATYSQGMLSERSLNVYEYDSNGNMTQMLQYDKYSDLSERTTFTYDEKNNLTEQIDYDSSGNITMTRTYSYNDKGLLQKETQNGYQDYYGEPTLYKGYTLYEYDDNDRLVKSTNYNSSGQKLYDWITTYDDNGNRTSLLQYLSSGQEYLGWCYTYDENGNLTECKYRLESQEIERYIYTYDEAGQLIKMAPYSYGHEGQPSTYTYDENGKLTTSSVLDLYGTVRERTDYAYSSIVVSPERAKELLAEQSQLLTPSRHP